MLNSISEASLLATIGVFGGLILGLCARLGRFCTLGAIEDTLEWLWLVTAVSAHWQG